MIRRTSAFVICWLALAALALGAEVLQYSQPQFEEAVKRLVAAPLGPTAQADRRTIVAFTIQCHDVQIDIAPVIQKMMQGRDDDAAASLFAAYAAGQALGQLQAHARQGQAVAGATLAFEVYEKIRQAQPDYRNPALEEMLAARKAGQLEKLLTPPAPK